MNRVLRGMTAMLSYLLHMFFRHYDFPCECGLVKIGNPWPDSPVFLSGNYSYTVGWLKRVLRGFDCYLLVADSSGSNVWCAAGMNEFSEHDIIDAVNVARLGEIVRHRKLVAPPYAAPGVDIDKVKEETGFQIVWGPSHLRDLPRYIRGGLKRTHDMLGVQFKFRDRIEPGMSSAMAYVIMFAVVGILAPRYFVAFMLLFVGVHFVSFAFWPWLPEERYWARTLTLLAILAAALGAYGRGMSWDAKEIWIHEAILLGVVVFVATDHCGTTSIYKTTIIHWLKTGNYRSLFNPVIDPARCNNCARCLSVCPKNVLARLPQAKKAVVVQPTECMECLACVKQCGQKAIYDRNYFANGGRLKGDVKSIPDLDLITGRDPSHLVSEDRWIGAKTVIQGEFRYVEPGVEGALSGMEKELECIGV